MLDIYEELEYVEDDNYIQHYGIMGMKWGVRRYQNEDGTLTPEGMRRYSGDIDSKSSALKIQRKLNNADKISSDYVGRTIGNLETARKLRAKGKNEKAEKFEKQARKDMNTSKSIDSETWKVYAKAVENGMNVKVKDVMRMTDKAGSDAYLAQMIAGLPGGLINATIKSIKYTKANPAYDTNFTNSKTGQTKKVHQNEDMVVGKQYKVRKNKEQ